MARKAENSKIGSKDRLYFGTEFYVRLNLPQYLVSVSSAPQRYLNLTLFDLQNYPAPCVSPPLPTSLFLKCRSHRTNIWRSSAKSAKHQKKKKKIHVSLFSLALCEISVASFFEEFPCVVNCSPAHSQYCYLETDVTQSLLVTINACLHQPVRYAQR